MGIPMSDLGIAVAVYMQQDKGFGLNQSLPACYYMLCSL